MSFSRMRLAGVLILLVTFSFLAFAQDKTDVPVSELDQVTLSLDEYNKLLDLALKPPKKIDQPPLSYSVKHAGLNLHTEGMAVLGTIQIDGEVFKKGISKVALTSGLTLRDAQQGTNAVPLQQENGTQYALLCGPADFSISLQAGTPLNIEPGRASFILPVPIAGTTQLTLTVPGDHTYVNISPGLVTARKSENGHTTIEATLVPGQPTNLWWATREAATSAVPHEVRFLSDVKTLSSISEAELRIAALVDINVIQGEPSQFDLELPSGYEVTGATGAALDSIEPRAGLLILKLNSASARNYQFLVTLEKAISGSKADVPFLAVRGAQRETGEVLVEGAGSVEITATESGGLKRMDVKEANAYLRGLAHFPPQAAFRYHRQANENPALALEWVRYPDSSVLAAVAENAEVTTMVTSEGKSLTEVKLSVKNQAQPFLKVALPLGASILSADVAGEKVKPVQAPDGSRVPLLRPGFRTTNAYTVSFVFMHSGAPFAKKGGSDLALPAMDIPISMMHWEVFLPEQYKVKDFHGDVISEDLVPPAFHEAPVLTSYIPAVSGSFPEMLPGQIGGFVTDPSGAVVPNVKVTVTALESGVTRNALSDEAGRWLVSNIPSGSLRITAQSPGFTSQAVNLSYDANHPTRYNFSLNVGSVAESVTVSAGAVLARSDEIERDIKKQAAAAQNTASVNVVNLQRRVAGVLPIAIDVPHTGTSFRFVRLLVLDEETKVEFSYKSK